VNSKEEGKEFLEGLSSVNFETAARILSSLAIEGIKFFPATLKSLLLETFPDLSKSQIKELVEVFSKRGENNNE